MVVTHLRGLTCGLAVALGVGGCLPEPVVKAHNERLAEMRAEIEALAADKSASDDSDCGFTRYNVGTCQRVDLVYSRATVDETLLLEKVQEYNEFNRLLVQLYGYDRLLNTCVVTSLPSEVRSESGVCVAVYPTGP